MKHDDELLIKILKLSHEQIMAGKSYSQEEAERSLEDLDWDKIPSFGPFSDEEAIARIDKFEEELARGEVEWISDEEAREKLYSKYPWLK
jgi:hypothetical protein